MNFWDSFFGAMFGLITAFSVIAFQHFLSHWEDQGKKKLLRHMLDNPPQGTEWRELSTLARVIGSSEEETTRLLISIKARGSETKNNVWAYVKNHPLP